MIKTFFSVRHIYFDRCSDCGFVFANPAPSDRSVDAFYNSKFYANYRTLEEDNIIEYPYFSISSYTDPRRLAGWITNDKSDRILDFGCGPASFLALLRDEFGFMNTEGYELNKMSADVAKRRYNIDLTPSIGQLRYSKYDVIILFEVIEHVTRPEELISLCTSLLTSGGRLFITTPSVRNIPARFFPAYCSHYTGPSHVSLFTETAMTRLLSRFNMKIERLETDPAPVLGNAIVSPLYNMDFVSPRSLTDYSDILYVPNILGKMMGLRETRRAGTAFPFRVVRKIERMFNQFLKDRYSDHLYVLAAKN
jgi:2-polyprenyl-3-methyl-5-hydroxy-6-metoxy-1,4-benzoquinol methylase